jgi:hypothetical protein
MSGRHQAMSEVNMRSVSASTLMNGVANVHRDSPTRSTHRIRKIAATATALTFMLQNFAWAVCNNNTNFPLGGFSPATAINWSPLTFTGTLGSVWVPDISVNEHNNTKEPLTQGGHDWVFDQGSTTCKETDVGGASGPVTAWSIPPNNAADCILLPIIKIVSGQLVVQNFGDIPQRGTALTPTCDPTKLSTTAPNPANTYFNQLGCALLLLNTGKVQLNTPQTATTYFFTSGIKSGLFAYLLNNVSVSTPGQEAGKTLGGGLLYYARLNPGQRFDSAVITPDGKYLLGASSKTNDAVFACRNPLGDPGDLTKPINLQAFAVSTNTNPSSLTAPGVQCMQIGQGGDTRVKGLALGGDGQPYMAGVGIVANFTNFPACIATGFGVPAGTTTDQAIALAFAANSQNHCGTATPNKVLNTDPSGVAIKNETFALVSHGQYLYRAIKFGIVYQAKIGATGATAQRVFATGLASPTGVGFSQDNGTPAASTMLYDDPTALGLTAQERIYKLPICEDIQ